jgi:hypothetical protein
MANIDTTNENLQSALTDLVEKVTNTAVLETTTYLINYIEGRVQELTQQTESTEYDYCEHLGRIKELELLLQTLKELKTLN